MVAMEMQVASMDHEVPTMVAIQAAMEILLMEVAPIEMALITEISVALVVSVASVVLTVVHLARRKSRECRQPEISSILVIIRKLAMC